MKGQLTMTNQTADKTMVDIFSDYVSGELDAIDVNEYLKERGLNNVQRIDVLATWRNARTTYELDTASRETNADLYKRLEKMARANPIVQTLKSISVKLERLTNQADRLDALLIPFAGPYPDLPTLMLLENLYSAIDDLPRPFVKHFSTELDMLRVQSTTTQVWLEALEQDYPDTDNKFHWTCKSCGRVNEDVDLCACGEMSTWRKAAIESDRKARETAGDKIYWECGECGQVNHDTDRCKCGHWSPWFKSRNLAANYEVKPF